MNDDFTFLIFTYHNVFLSLLSGWENGTGVVRCWRDMRAFFHVCVPNPASLGYDQDQFSTQNWVKTTQRSYPAGSTQHLGRKNYTLECKIPVKSQKLRSQTKRDILDKS